jgi:ubiquitin-conjugating enzyme E2 J1
MTLLLVRTVLLAVIGFFPTESRGAIGGLDYPPAERKRLAKKSIDWSCPTCHAHNKEALSDIEPAESSTTSEEMPKFEITYKPVQDTEVEKKQEDNQPSASASSATISTQKEEENVPKVVEKAPKVVEASSSSSTTRTQSNRTSLQSSVHSNNNNNTSSSSSSSSSSSNGRPPVWLDGLIGALLAFVITLMIKKYIL